MRRRFSASTRALSTGWVPAARGDAHRHESGLRYKLTPPECATTASSVAPETLEKVADVRLTNSFTGASATVVINALKFLHRARAERDYLLSTMD